jgi:hypothetical protein
MSKKIKVKKNQSVKITTKGSKKDSHNQLRSLFISFPEKLHPDFTEIFL